jgi:spore coat polysaccharide biosynthesis protein SpsF
MQPNHSRSSAVKIVATIEARMASTRLPGKVLALAQGRPMLELMVERLRLVPELDAIVVATTKNASDDAIEKLAEKLGVGCWRGSEDDVMSRVLDAATAFGADVIVETTGDCPLIDPGVVSETIAAYRRSGADYVSNVLDRTYPIGMDTQVFATKTLADAAARTGDPADREHVSLYIYRHPERYSVLNVAASPSLTMPDLRLTLDTPEDLEVIRTIFAAFAAQGTRFSLADILQFLDVNPAIAQINAHVKHRYV